MRILCFIRASSFRSKELSMTASFVFLAAMVSFSVALIVVDRLFGKSSAAQASVEQVEARLVKRLPPDVQAEMKPRQPGLVISVVIAVVAVLPIIAAGLITTGTPNAKLIVGFGLIGAVGCAAWTAAIARNWIGRKTTGEVLADLTPVGPPR
jgi:hypothetical protein